MQVDAVLLQRAPQLIGILEVDASEADGSGRFNVRRRIVDKDRLLRHDVEALNEMVEYGRIRLDHPNLSGDHDSIKPVQKLKFLPRHRKSFGGPIREAVQPDRRLPQAPEDLHRAVDGAGDHLLPAIIVGADHLLVFGVLGNQQFAGLTHRTTGILLRIPFGCADVCKEPLNLWLIPKQFPVEISRVPIYEYAAEIEYDRTDAVLHRITNRDGNDYDGGVYEASTQSRFLPLSMALWMKWTPIAPS